MSVLNPLTLGQKDAANSLPVVLASGSTPEIGISSYPTLLSVKAKTAAVTTAVGIAAFGFSAQELLDATVAVICTFTNGANFLTDGSTATTTFGIPLTAASGGVVFEGNANINDLSVVSQTGTANVTLALYKYA